MSTKQDFCDGCTQHCKLGAAVTNISDNILTIRPTINSNILYKYRDEHKLQLIHGITVTIGQENYNQKLETALDKMQKEARRYATICAQKTHKNR